MINSLSFGILQEFVSLLLTVNTKNPQSTNQKKRVNICKHDNFSQNSFDSISIVFLSQSSISPFTTTNLQSTHTLLQTNPIIQNLLIYTFSAQPETPVAPNSSRTARHETTR